MGATMFRCVILIAVVLTSICAPNASHAECEKLVTQTVNPQLRYQDRKDRCEGLYFQPVAASARIRIVAFFDDPPVPSEPVNERIPLVALGATSESHIFFRAVSARYRQYFRMDAQANPAGRFTWKTDIVRALNIAPRELMVLACDGGCDLAEPRLLPISGLSDPRRRIRQRLLVFTSSVDLEKVHVKLTDISGKQIIEKEHDLLEGEMLSAGTVKQYYGLTGKPPGLYRIQLTAVPRYSADAAGRTQAVLQIPTD
jgi:hypothetical protein